MNVEKIFANIQSQTYYEMAKASLEGRTEEIAKLSTKQTLARNIANAYVTQVDAPYYKDVLSGSDMQVYNSLMRVSA